jgi:hypothetical protein
MTVPLIPFKRPVPKIFVRRVSGSPPLETKNTRKKRKQIMAKAKFNVTNVEDITKKPQAVQRLWKLLSKMDPEGDLWVNDKGIIAVAGDTAKDAPERTPKALKLDSEDIETIAAFAICDGPEPDNAELATGVIFTVYQMVEIAFAAGVQFESERLTGAITAAANKPSADDEDEDDEDEDSEDEEMEELSDDDEDDDEDDE